jgi:hypothetical protein
MQFSRPSELQESEDHSAARLNWLTPARCRSILVAVLALGFIAHLIYLARDCPIDLSGDEAHYWDWSRQLDLSYYSKGPLVAYIIRGSCAVFGDVMWAVRLPALVLAMGTAVVTYLLTLKLFGSDRLALGAVLLNGLVPMFIAGSVLMTIDPPFFFCWALATYLAVHAIFDNRRWCWPVIGIVVGIGFLAKYAMFLWLPTMLLVLWVDRPSRKILRTPGPWWAIASALLFTIPVLLWNARHGWVSFRHVATQTGTNSAGRFAPTNFLEFIGGQIGVLGPPIAVIIAGACVYAWKQARRDHADPRTREMTFLLATGLPFFALTTLTSIRAKVQPNWPAPAYFTLLILAAYFLATRMRDSASWRPWRGWFYGAVVTGVVATPILHHTELLYPFIRWQHHVRNAKGVPSANRVDPTARLKGWQEQANLLALELDSLGPAAFVMCDDYQSTAEMAFYLPGQPKTYCAGAYFSGERRRRHTQYDVWPDRSLDPARRPEMLGRNAIYVGFMNDDILRAFERVDGPHHVDVMRRGVKTKTIRYARCYGFKGMSRSGGVGSY